MLDDIRYPLSHSNRYRLYTAMNRLPRFAFRLAMRVRYIRAHYMNESLEVYLYGE